MKTAWERRDTQGVMSLFVEGAEYREDPFGEPLRGERAIRNYWADAARSQRDIKVSYELLSAYGGVGIVRWQAAFVRVPSGQKVELEGIAHFKLNRDGKCTQFLEWWNRKQTS